MGKEYLQPHLDDEPNSGFTYKLKEIQKEVENNTRPNLYGDRQVLSLETNSVIELLCDIIKERDEYIKLLNSRLTELEDLVEQDPTPIQIAKWRMDNTE